MAADHGYLYWSNQRGGSIGRASLTGGPVTQDFIPGATKPLGVAADDSGVYWADNGTGSIGHADLDGSQVTPSFITEARAPIGIAVDAGADKSPPQTRITKGIRKRTAAGHVKFKFRSSERRSRFQCRFDAEKWKRCRPPRKIKNLDAGRHVFRVRAIDIAGNVDPTPARDAFKEIGKTEAVTPAARHGAVGDSRRRPQSECDTERFPGG